MSSHSFGGAPVILVALLAVASTANAAPSATRVRAVFPTENDAWHRGPPGFPGGSMFAVVSGDPVQTGPFMIRVELPSGYRLPPYRRPHDENINWVYGLGARQSRLSARTYLALIMLAFPIVVFLPTHFALKTWFPPA